MIDSILNMACLFWGIYILYFGVSKVFETFNNSVKYYHSRGKIINMSTDFMTRTQRIN